MFRLTRSKRRRERVWKILKERNSELTREQFNGAYDHINYVITAVAEKN